VLAAPRAPPSPAPCRSAPTGVRSSRSSRATWAGAAAVGIGRVALFPSVCD